MDTPGGQTVITITTDGKVSRTGAVGSKVDLEDLDDDDDDEDVIEVVPDKESRKEKQHLKEEDMFEIVMDEESEDEESVDEESVDEDWDMDEMKSPEDMQSSLQETKRIKTLKEYTKDLESVAARSLYVNKIFANYDGLSKKQKELVVEYLDRAKNPEDAKRIYERIKKQLNEAKADVAFQFERKTGSLNESVSRRPVNSGNAAERIVIGSAERFRELVNNKKNG
jgi:hypothetical protein